ncbi:hypothetical protein M409DRAFT_28289 [Zasmidium cellare ATCC 36951]|uniref:ZZ-type domain-containing protein n=1 Tax=Zasmidium cellare ATCC 36951 TaxID=1080233 RepID=A0A6A6C4Y9_ZASCE|nr:uncharacterized protein M409DRAFT_28289 [Zasmidium cellare ATCC 36951]KAF2161250.1 hypothetical protein M409DRAFT_28289 [Zasmidium cellare ATCC 36951]
MSGTDPIIKQEPLDDEPTTLFNVPEDHEPAFVDANTVLRRAADNEGRQFPTVCFRAPRLQHPHHHRLICGHDIVTETIQKCGHNCAMSEDKKPNGMGFECPHPDCEKVASHFIRQRNAPKPRKCILSHVYGRDSKADEERMEEKRILQEAKRVRINTRSGEVLLPQALRRLRKRSPSPAAESNPRTRRTNTNAKHDSDFDVGESLNRDYEHDPARKSIMRMTGGRARANGLFMTDKQISDAGRITVLTQGMSASQVATAEEQRTRKKKALKISSKSRTDSKGSGPDTRGADPEPELKVQSECDNCDKPIDGIRYHCFDCIDGFDLCAECFGNNTHGHTLTHRFKALAQPSSDWQEGLTMLQQSFCVCGTTSTSFLVLCSDCEHPFHPGCIGTGAWEKAEYGIEYFSRGTCMRHDRLNWKGGKVFRCESCQKVYNEANVGSARDFRMDRRAKKQKDGAEKQQEKAEQEQENAEGQELVLSPKLRPRKRMADEVDDRPEFRADEAQPTNEAKRFKFDLAFRPKD